MGVVNTTYTFSGTDTITSSKLNNIIDETTFTSDAIANSTLQIVSPGKLAVAASGITANELGSNAVTTAKISNNAVTQAKTNNSLVPSGAVMAFAMNSVPAGWLHANGTNVSRTTYSTLFAAIGTTYGSGNGSTTFTLPDLRGYFVRGSGTNSDGTASGTFGAKQADEFKAHTHTVGVQNSAARESGGGDTIIAGGTFTTDSTGGTETRPKNIAMLYCIKI